MRAIVVALLFVLWMSSLPAMGADVNSGQSSKTEVTILSPLQLTCGTGESMYIWAQARNPNGINRMAVYVNNSLVKLSYDSESVSCSWTNNSILNIPIRIMVEASSKDGQAGVAERTLVSAMRPYPSDSFPYRVTETLSNWASETPTITPSTCFIGALAPICQGANPVSSTSLYGSTSGIQYSPLSGSFNLPSTNPFGYILDYQGFPMVTTNQLNLLTFSSHPFLTASVPYGSSWAPGLFNLYSSGLYPTSSFVPSLPVALTVAPKNSTLDVKITGCKNHK